MRINFVRNTLLCAVLVSISAVNAQKKGDKAAKFLNYTFDILNDNNAEVSEAGQIGLLKGLKPSSNYPADAFRGEGDFGVGQNIYGYAKPLPFSEEKFEGDDANLFRYGEQNLGYAGIVTYKQNKTANERSYITIPFTDESGKKSIKMTAGKMYCFEMSISLAEASKFSTNNIGILFAKNVGYYQTDKIDEEAKALPFFEDNTSGRIIYNTKNRVYNSYGGWDKVCNIYIAKGDETGLVIGNFTPNDKTKYEVNKKPSKMESVGDVKAEMPAILPMAYYYIDNVRIKEVDSKEKCYCIKRDTTTMIQPSRVVITKDFSISEKLSEVQNIEAQVIYYAQGENKPDETGKEIIEYIGNYLKENEGVSIEIISHNDRAEDSLASEYSTDEDIVEKYGNLSEKRMEYIKQRFIERFEISPSRIFSQTKGADEENTKETPKDADEEMRMAYNRRVTFVIK